MKVRDTDLLVSVYQSTAVANAEAVQTMLASNGINATVSDSEGPFVGLIVAPSEVLVWKHDEALARSLIEKAHGTRHHETA